MTPEYYSNVENRYNLTNAIDNMINNLINIGIVNEPIDQIISRYSDGIPVVDGYVFNGWDENPVFVTGQLTNETVFHTEEVIPICHPIVVGKPVFPEWALEVCFIYGQQI